MESGRRRILGVPNTIRVHPGLWVAFTPWSGLQRLRFFAEFTLSNADGLGMACGRLPVVQHDALPPCAWVGASDLLYATIRVLKSRVELGKVKPSWRQYFGKPIIY